MRFIPACVGNSQSFSARKMHCSVHPRVCGEQAVHAHLLNPQIGSSPRVWGTAGGSHHPGYAARFIPACVGNSMPSKQNVAVFAVHPRVCGEQAVHSFEIDPGDGSSPRVWGTVYLLKLSVMRFRFIPACVGNRDRHMGPCTGASVHPRVCGEQGLLIWCFDVHFGSSPRVWGTVPPHMLKICGLRFIPACVGNSTDQSRRENPETVHPRVCGEQNTLACLKHNLCGSSPRVWGTANSPAAATISERFIPACVGNSCKQRRPRLARPVHPRVCGEQLAKMRRRN